MKIPLPTSEQVDTIAFLQDIQFQDLLGPTAKVIQYWNRKTFIKLDTKQNVNRLTDQRDIK